MIVYAGHILGRTGTEESFYGAILEHGQNRKALIGKGEFFLGKLLGIYTVAADHMAFPLLVGIIFSAVQSQKHHAVKGYVLLDIIKNLAVDVLDGHGLEKLVLVTIQNAELVLTDIVLGRNKTLVVKNKQGASNVGHGLGRRLTKGIRVKGIHH